MPEPKNPMRTCRQCVRLRKEIESRDKLIKTLHKNTGEYLDHLTEELNWVNEMISEEKQLKPRCFGIMLETSSDICKNCLVSRPCWERLNEK
jgi:hypothetical protein